MFHVVSFIQRGYLYVGDCGVDLYMKGSGISVVIYWDGVIWGRLSAIGYIPNMGGIL